MSSSSVQNRIHHLQSLFTKSSVKSFQAHNSKIHSVAWNVDGRRLASGSTDKTVAVFQFENREKLVNRLLMVNRSIYDENQSLCLLSLKKAHSKVTQI